MAVLISSFSNIIKSVFIIIITIYICIYISLFSRCFYLKWLTIIRLLILVIKVINY